VEVSISGRKVTLGEEISRGGEGAVYSLVGQADSVCKIYHQPVTEATKVEKLALMAKDCRTEQLGRVCAWPQDLAYSRNGALLGFTMKRLRNTHPIHQIYGPKDRINLFPKVYWDFLFHVAANVARAFATIHQHGHTIGDVNENNLLVDSTGQVHLIDCDSFEIRVEDKSYSCGVGVPHYTPPELQKKTLSSVRRVPNHDLFGLGVIIFQLLFMGRHPFSGRFSGSQHYELPDNIREFRFFYTQRQKNSEYGPPPWIFGLNSVGSRLAELFELCFTERFSASRPEPQSWIDALTQAQKGLLRCVSSRAHQYLSGGCHWCDLERQSQGRVVYFSLPPDEAPQVQMPTPSPEAKRTLEQIQSQLNLVSIHSFDLDAAILVQISNFPVSQDISSLVTSYRALLAQPKPKQDDGSVGCAGCLFALLGIVGFASHHEIAGAFSVFLGFVGFVHGANQPNSAETSELIKKRNELEARQSLLKTQLAETDQELISLKQAWNLDAQRLGVQALQREKSRVNETFSKFREKLGGERLARDEFRVERNREKLKRFLAGFSVRECTYSRISAANHHELLSNGIENAADVTPAAVKACHGFGEKKTSALCSWRKELEAKFRPPNSLTPAEEATFQKSFQDEINRLMKKADRDYKQFEANAEEAREKADGLSRRIAVNNEKRGPLMRDLDALQEALQMR
jgi:DNA-binding helix-hairpin-helix protein with protein kinase domain